MSNFIKGIKSPKPYEFLLIAGGWETYEILWVSGPRAGRKEDIPYGEFPGDSWVHEPYSVREIPSEKLMRRIREHLHHADPCALADYFTIYKKWGGK